MLSYPQLQVNRTNEAKRMDEDAAPRQNLTRASPERRKSARIADP